MLRASWLPFLERGGMFCLVLFGFAGDGWRHVMVRASWPPLREGTARDRNLTEQRTHGWRHALHLPLPPLQPPQTPAPFLTAPHPPQPTRAHGWRQSLLCHLPACHPRPNKRPLHPHKPQTPSPHPPQPTRVHGGRQALLCQLLVRVAVGVEQQPSGRLLKQVDHLWPFRGCLGGGVSSVQAGGWSSSLVAVIPPTPAPSSPPPCRISPSFPGLLGA